MTKSSFQLNNIQHRQHQSQQHHILNYNNNFDLNNHYRTNINETTTHLNETKFDERTDSSSDGDGTNPYYIRNATTNTTTSTSTNNSNPTNNNEIYYMSNDVVNSTANSLNEYYSLRNSNHESSNGATPQSNVSSNVTTPTSSSTSTFTELQPAAIYTQLPSIDTLGNSVNNNNNNIKTTNLEFPYVYYNNNNDTWKIQGN